mgnify:CR=1 FL=1
MLMFIFVFVNDFVAEEEKLRLQLARSLKCLWEEAEEQLQTAVDADSVYGQAHGIGGAAGAAEEGGSGEAAAAAAGAGRQARARRMMMNLRSQMTTVPTKKKRKTLTMMAAITPRGRIVRRCRRDCRRRQASVAVAVLLGPRWTSLRMDRLAILRRVASCWLPRRAPRRRRRESGARASGEGRNRRRVTRGSGDG